MDVPDSVPSLAALINDNAKWSRLCHWPIKKRGKQKPRTCAKPIDKSDVKERDGLIKELRQLIPAATEANTPLGSAIPDLISDIHAKLKKVSQWLVCKAEHRQGNATAIFQKWCDELDNLEKTRDQPVAEDIRKELDIDDGKRVLCQGRTKKGARCTNWISNKNRECADAIIEVVARARNSSSTTRDNILVLAQLLMCRRYHQDQAIRKSEEWFARIQELFPLTDAAQEQPSTPPFNRVSAVDGVATQSTVSSISSRADSIAYSTPATSPPSRRRYNGTTTSPVSSLFSRSVRATETTTNEQPPRETQTRSTRKRIIEPELVLPQFEPLSPKGSKAMLNSLYKLMTRPFIKKDGAPGYLYGFTRDDGAYIKVGYTNRIDLEERMDEWRQQCHQELIVILVEPVPHAQKIESLVHATLYNERRREVLVNGKCNGGRGCPTRHIEWLEVTEKRLRGVVDKWIRWFEATPYKKGKLRPKWVDYIDNLRQTQSKGLHEPWHDWINVTIFSESAKVKAKIKMVDEKGTVAFNVGKKTESIITETEIKTESDDKVLADVAELRQELRRRSQRYNQRIKELKDETQEAKPLLENTAVKDLSHDPFVASATTALPRASLRGGRKTEAYPA
jgi:hypothetical protein